jgi:transglutaminase-like putative cysteine protease
MKHILKIRHESHYVYEREVSLSPHSVRLFPRIGSRDRQIVCRFSCSGGGMVHHRRDLFENEVAIIFFPEATKEMRLVMDLQLEVAEKNPFHFLLDSGGYHIPPNYTDRERSFLQAFLVCHGSKKCPLPEPFSPGGVRQSMELLLAWNRWIYENLTYERREHGAPQTPVETLSNGRGTCRDFAGLLIESLRQNGVGARWVSGFLWEPPDKDQRVADSALHAWVEAYLPGAGWIGLDPTNGVLTDHTAVPTAIGLEHSDVAPVSGSYYSDSPVSSTLHTSLQIDFDCIAESPESK